MSSSHNTNIVLYWYRPTSIGETMYITFRNMIPFFSLFFFFCDVIVAPLIGSCAISTSCLFPSIYFSCQMCWIDNLKRFGVATWCFFPPFDAVRLSPHIFHGFLWWADPVTYFSPYILYMKDAIPMYCTSEKCSIIYKI